MWLYTLPVLLLELAYGIIISKFQLPTLHKAVQGWGIVLFGIETWWSSVNHKGKPCKPSKMLVLYGPTFLLRIILKIANLANRLWIDLNLFECKVIGNKKAKLEAIGVIKYLPFLQEEMVTGKTMFSVQLCLSAVLTRGINSFDWILST